eukprot:2489017-Alexandrium_andersonii.AAC.1
MPRRTRRSQSSQVAGPLGRASIDLLVHGHDVLVQLLRGGGHEVRGESACFSTVATLRPPQCPPERPSAKRLRMAKFQPAPRNAPPAPTAASFKAPKSCRPSTVGQTATWCWSQALASKTSSSSSLPRPRTVPFSFLRSSSWAL